MDPEDEGLKKGIYEDLKGNKYELIGVGRNTETYEKIVICKKIETDNDYDLIPLHIFKMKRKIDGKEVECFKFIK